MTLPPVMLSLYIPDGLTKEDQTGNTVLEEGDGNAADIPLIGRGSSEESDDAAREVLAIATDTYQQEVVL
uniref:Uncharacterized protein n=1 Tax=Kwoniella dejecticola CBS 10117 TaxID=1296121 RepID=A0A1A5ZZA9_9TREE|nr:uncharacterized protein I303_06679 [Kwoniella dejecticola CBS 10117]OBR83120.1 hypothetical protein I303_06679 [Kwoniella dejecticola CBS 10117]